MSISGTGNSRSTLHRLAAVAGVSTPLVAGAMLLLWAVRAGLPWVDMLTALSAVVLTQVVPGVVVWRVVRPRRGWWAEDLAMGFGVGSVLALLAQIPAGFLDWRWLSGAITLSIAVCLLVVPQTRSRVLSATTMPLPWWWGPSVAASIFVAFPQLRTYFRMNPLDWEAGARALHIDTYLHLSLAGQLAHRGPTTFPWVKSEALGYHWFSHAWIAQVGVTSGAELDGILLRFMPVLVPVVVVAAAASAALRLTGRPWSAPVAAALTVAGGSLNVLGKINPGLPMTPLSPSLGLSVPMLLALVVLLAMRWRGEALRGAFVLVPVLSLGAAGTKGSATPLVVAGLGLAIVAMTFADRRRLPALVGDMALVMSGLVAALVGVFRGSGAGLHFSIQDAAEQTPIATWLGGLQLTPLLGVVLVATVVGVLSRGALGLAVFFESRSRRDPLTWFLLGGGLAGAGATIVFAHPGRSQWYFALNAVPLLALFSTLGLVVLHDAWPRRTALRILLIGAVGGLVVVWLPAVLFGPLLPGQMSKGAWMLLVGAVALVVVGCAGAMAVPGVRLMAASLAMAGALVAGGMSMVWDSVRTPPPAAAGPVKLKVAWAASRDQIDAARWIRSHSGVDDVVMTNRHCATPVDPMPGCDSRRWLVAAYSERQMLVEGWTATPRSAEEGPKARDSITVPYWHPSLLRLNDTFIAQPSRQAAAALARRGVRWVFVDHTRPHADSLEPFAHLRYSNRGVDVYELPAAR